MPRAPLALGAFASLLGFFGVALAAASAHAGGNELARTASLFLLLHAATLLGVSAHARSTPVRALIGVGFASGLGSLLFSADLASRAFLSERLFPFAAPIGGSLMSLSWLAMAVVFSFPPSTRREANPERNRTDPHRPAPCR
jgi:uncharacterized membrane protein YgdD (TMEM256/DUF423 family)